MPNAESPLQLPPLSAEQALQQAIAHHQAGQVQEAERLYRAILQSQPDHPDANHNLGVLAVQLKQPSAALPHFKAALDANPNQSQYWVGYIDALVQTGQIDVARQVLAQGRQFGLKGEAVDALAARLEGSVQVAAQSTNPTPQEIETLVALFAERRYTEVVPLAQAMTARFPLHGFGWKVLGAALKEMGRSADALAHMQKAAALLPHDAEAHYNLGNTLQHRGKLVEAIANYQRALEITPDFAEAHSNLVFALDLIESYGIEELQAERRRWYEQHGLRFARAIKPHDNPPDLERRLRVGYVSADFRRHSAYYIFSPIILRHDCNAFEVVCYSGVKVEDDATARLRQAVHEWRSTLGVSDEALAEQIRRDRIDILVDLSGHSAGNRLLVFARKPAPVQVTAWGHAHGTGLKTIDYLLADPVTVPQEERSLYAEEVIDLPCILCYEPPDYLPEVSPLPALGDKPFTFGCINRIEKISDRMIVLWGQILGALPKAQLLIKDRMCDDAGVRQQLLQRLGATGIAAERVHILGHSPHPEHLKIFGEVDVGLDPFPHGGGVSTAEALWMGVPVVSLRGPTIPSRVSSSQLTALGMPEWIARNGEEYVRIAVEAARDLPRLARQRGELRSRLAASMVGDVQRYTHEVEAAFRSMWRRWCAGRNS